MIVYSFVSNYSDEKIEIEFFFRMCDCSVYCLSFYCIQIVHQQQNFTQQSLAEHCETTHNQHRCTSFTMDNINGNNTNENLLSHCDHGKREFFVDLIKN